MGSKNNWDADAMKGTLISDMEREVMEGISKAPTEQQGDDTLRRTAGHGSDTGVTRRPTNEKAAEGGRGKAAECGRGKSERDKEPTKGVQTYIPMSMYRRLNDIKLTRRENIAALVAQAIELWLDVQEGKKVKSEE